MRESAKPVPAYILARGDYTQPSEKVEPRDPRLAPALSQRPAAQPPRLREMAHLAGSSAHRPRHRSTASGRKFSDTGIVETSDNFGLQGAQPTHPELLDWLARDFMDHGWDHKRAIRQMVLSATYAQDSKASPELRERDPANALLARGPARRLTAEMLRDSALALSGLLAETIGGPPGQALSGTRLDVEGPQQLPPRIQAGQRRGPLPPLALHLLAAHHHPA